jgi:hypothetical protein
MQPATPSPAGSRSKRGEFRVELGTRPVLREPITKRGAEIFPKAGALSVALAALALALAFSTLTPSAPGAPRVASTSQATLSQARVIRDDLNARIGLVPGAGLYVTEATSTDVVDSFTLLSENLLDARFVPARGGVWYTICPDRALCPYPASRLSRPASDRLARRLALELVLRTFLASDAPVVGVSLPTPHFVAVVFEREELAAQVDMPALARALRAEPLLDPAVAALAKTAGEGQRLEPASPLQRAIDELTRPRTYLFLGFEPGPYGPMSWAGMPCWPTVDW